MIGLNIFGIALLFILIGYLIGNILFGLIVSKIKKVDLRSQGSGNVGATNAMRIMGKTIGFLVLSLDFLKGFISCFISLVIYKYLFKTFIDESNMFLYNHFGFLIYVSGLFAVIGHCYPIPFLVVLFKNKFDVEKASKYSGGKGVATTAGLIAAISPWLFFICFAIFFSTVLIWRYVSLSSITSAVLIPFFTLIPHLDYLYLLNTLDANILMIPSIENSGQIINVINYTTNSWYLAFIFVILLFSSSILVYRHKANILRLKTKTEKKIF